MKFAGKDIPLELLYKLMLMSDRYTLQQMCQINTLTADICSNNNDYFWREKLEFDYKYDRHFTGKTFKETWILYPYTFTVIIDSAYIEDDLIDENDDNNFNEYNPDDPTISEFLPHDDNDVELIEKTIMSQRYMQILEENLEGNYEIIEVNAKIGEPTEITVYRENALGFPVNVSVEDINKYCDQMNIIFNNLYYEENYHIYHIRNRGVDSYVIPHFRFNQ